MRANFGEHFKLTIFGESHGPAIGVVVDGLPAGARLDEDYIAGQMARRAPGGDPTATARKEADAVRILSGAMNGRATGAPLCAMIENTNTRSGDYASMAARMRPGHADYAGYVKYCGMNDPRGGGHFSGRLTAPLVFAGSVARLLLREKGIEIGGHIAAIAGERDARFDPVGVDARTLCGLAQSRFPLLNPEKEAPMRRAVAEARAAQDSVGGVIECAAVGVRAGVGSPFFGSVESVVSQLAFSVPAVKAIAFGDGMALAEMCGSEANDAMRMDGDGVTCESNHNGGVTGGITNGMPVIFRAAIKPTPSIARAQRTVDVAKRENAVLEIAGRHDPCIVPRAVVVMESILAIALCELEMDDAAQRALTEGVLHMRELESCRREIDEIDAELVRLFERRMGVCRDVALYKQAHYMDILNAAREETVLKSRAQQVSDPALAQSVMALFTEIMRLSREEQRRYLEAQTQTRLIAYSGVPGAYSECAVVGFFGEDCERVSFKTFDEVFAAVADGKARYGVVPVENSSSGSINDVYDLLGKYACHIVGEQLVRVEHCLLGVPGAKVSDITQVFSHEQGFAQCPKFLGEHPDWVTTPYFNTAIAARHVAEMGDKRYAAIASRLAAKHYGLDVIAPDIHTFDGNHTRFVIVSASPTPIGIPDKATVTFTLRHERGTLMRALSSFVAMGMNMTHIESRPLHNSNWEYCFYVDLTGNLRESNLGVLMGSLQGDCENCRLLGAYHAAREDAHA